MDINIRKADDDARREHHQHDALHHASHTRPHNVVSHFKRISWGAVFAGFFVSLLSMILLNMLGIGIGAGAIEPIRQSNPFEGIGIGAAVWFLVSLVVSVFIGGWVAGRVAGMPRTPEGLIHGVVAYSLFTIVMFWSVTSAAGSIISGAGSILGNTISSSGTARNSVDQMIQDITKKYNQEYQNNPQAQQNAEQQARIQGDKAARAIAQAALWLFFGILLGGISAAVGGKLGEPKPVIIRSARPTTDVPEKENVHSNV